MTNDQNKTELFGLMANSIVSIESEKLIVATAGPNVKSNRTTFDKSCLEPCHKEEPDDRIFLHTLSCAKQGMKKITIQTVDLT